MKTLIKRLKHLITILERVDVEGLHFNMSRWGEYNTELDCMTACCAMGHACLDEEFKKQGLKVVYIDRSWFCPTFKETQYFDACKSFFHLNENQADYIFMENFEGEKPSDVIKRINYVLEVKML